MNEFGTIADSLVKRAKRDGARLYVYEDPFEYMIRFVLEKDGCSVKKRVSKDEIWLSLIPVYTLMNYKYDRWFEELQKKINEARSQGAKGE